ncbi:MAG: CPBP family intramembrane glutamic endopeptidase, partial [Candidatus Hadarchaeota archaeon]|nr:CPBP family intramembrane glutamic endopeptidase [Candidatus Hadarchaeota archaeon]
LAGLVISALIFAAFHLSNPGMYPASIIPMTVGGLILGTCYLLGGLASAIVCHSLYNAMLIVI